MRETKDDKFCDKYPSLIKKKKTEDLHWKFKKNHDLMSFFLKGKKLNLKNKKR